MKNIKNIAIVKPINMYNVVEKQMYKNKYGLILVEFEDDTRRYLDIKSRVDITDYEEWIPMINEKAKMEYIFEGDIDYYK